MTQDLVLLAAGIGLTLGLLYAGMVFALWKVAATIPTHYHWVMFVLGIGPLLLGEAIWVLHAPPTLTPVLGYLARGLILILAGALDILAYLLRHLLRQRRRGTVQQVWDGTPPGGPT